MEAVKLNKKLNGSVLRGTKMRVEEAKPKQTSVATQEAGEPESRAETGTRHKVRVKEEGVIPAIEINDRKIKRGWTSPVSGEQRSSKKSKSKEDKKMKRKASSLTGEAECLFKTTLPPNATTAAASKDGKAKKRKRGDAGCKIVVHEFASTLKHPTFLRNGSDAIGKQSTSEYVEGKGWVDSEGSILEAEAQPRRRKAKLEEKVEMPAVEVIKPRSRTSSRPEAPSVNIKAPRTRRAKAELVEDKTSSSGTSSSSEEESHDDASDPSLLAQKKDVKQNEIRDINPTKIGDEAPSSHVERLSITRSSATPPPSQPDAPTSVPTQVSTEIHPLEALFKRPNNAASTSLTPRKPNLEVSTTFSFFELDIDDGGSQSTLMPQTPFTQQDIRHRRQRSAAPTPDTAMPGKTFGDVWKGNSDIDDDGDEEDIEMKNTMKEKESPEIKQEKPESEFSKWFWEHRGENNRAWKRRRREAVKEKRQKEHKARRA